ncbi:MAG: hypothetical protein WBZ48_02500 [Bacteroidota bacterium]
MIELPSDDQLASFIHTKLSGVLVNDFDADHLEKIKEFLFSFVQKYVLLNQQAVCESTVQSNEQETP